MMLVVLRMTKPSASELSRILERARAAELSYGEVGGTKVGAIPAGYTIDRYDRRLAPGADAFHRATEALRGWRAQIDAGVDVFPSGARVETGGTVLFVLKATGVWAVAPCRVVYVLDETDRFGFAYGTLPGHPERGEAAMTVDRDEDEGVSFRIVSFSRPADLVGRVGSPLTRRLQTRVTNRYIDAIAAAASR